MATTRRSTATAPSRSKGRSRTTTRRTPAKKRAPARRSAPPKWRQELASQLGGHANDALAIGLFVLALVAALGIYSNLSGPLGDGLDAAASLMLGAGRMVVPLVLLVAAGGVVIQRGDAPETRRDLRLAIGLALVCASIVGLLHIGHGSPGGDSLDPLLEAGGLLGALFGAPLHAALGGIGAVIVLIAVGLLGALLVFGAGLRQCGRYFVVAGRWLRAFGKQLFVLQPVRLDDAYEPDRPLLYDQVADELNASSPAPDIDLVAAEDEAPAEEVDDEEVATSEPYYDELEVDERRGRRGRRSGSRARR